MNGNDFLEMARRISCDECADSVDAGLEEVYKQARAEGERSGLEKAAEFLTPGMSKVKGGPFTNEQVEQILCECFSEAANKIRSIQRGGREEK